MKTRLALLTILLALGCAAPPAEPVVIRLLDLAGSHPEAVAELDARLHTLLGMLTETSDVDLNADDLDPDLEERLRALGYLN